MKRPWGRLLALLLVAALLACAVPAPCRAEGEPTTKEKVAKFFDQWVVNGNAIGNAIGAVVGQVLVGMVFPGPVGMVAGSLIGSFIGGYLGGAVDDQVGYAINYTAFNRPPLTQGGLWLAGVGPWEQFMYQVDQWVINGGNFAAMGCHLMLNFAARSIPGCGALAGPVFLTLADYITGTIGDNIDGTIDLGLVGRKIDEHQGSTVGSVPTTGGGAVEAEGHGLSGLKDAYQNVITQMRSGSREGAQRAIEGYNNLQESVRALLKKKTEQQPQP